MRVLLLALTALLVSPALPLSAAPSSTQEVVCVDGVCQVVGDSTALPVESSSPRRFPGYSVAAHHMGEMSTQDLLAFLDGKEPTQRTRSFWVGIVVALIGGLLLNLTPCVLPLIPVTLMMLGLHPQKKQEEAKRNRGTGIAYGLGITLAYGALGLLSAFAGLAFGTLQSSPWFSAVVALVMVLLALSMFGVFTLDFSTLRRRSPRPSAPTSLAVPLMAGMGFALLAGACIAPVVLETLLAASTWPLWIGWTLPLALGLGMGAPWMLLGEHLPRWMPKPGAWMVWINRAFGLLTLAFAFHYGLLAWNGFRPSAHPLSHPSPTSIPWLTDADDAFLEAELDEKPIFVDLWATWCRSCTAMEQGPMQDPRIQEALADVVPLRLQIEDPNTPDAIALFRELGFGKIRGLPAFAILKREAK